jgi:hypothetical protein
MHERREKRRAKKKRGKEDLKRGEREGGGAKT